MASQRQALLEVNLRASQKAFALYLHSAKKLKPLKTIKDMSEDELEPYDALVSRFERAVEIFLNKCSKSVCAEETGAIPDVLRDRLNFLAKLKIVAEAEQWLEMREVRNRIAHDYLPEQAAAIYNDLIKTYRSIVEKAVSALSTYGSSKGFSDHAPQPTRKSRS
jgi:uncharacterized protein YutE (UPF0331/DUF86 family)